jgi:hypothetical protein
VTPARQVSRRRKTIDVVEHERRRSGPLGRHDPRQRGELLVAHRLQQLGCDQLALAAHDAVQAARPVLDQLGRDERSAVAAGEDEALRLQLPRLPGEVEHLGHVGEVVQAEADRLGLERRELTEVVPMVEDLQVEQPNLMTGLAHCRRHALDPEGLEAQVDLGVHQGARMNQQHAHEMPPQPDSPERIGMPSRETITA